MRVVKDHRHLALAAFVFVATFAIGGWIAPALSEPPATSQEVAPATTPPPATATSVAAPSTATAATATLRGIVRVPEPRAPAKSKSDYEAPEETTLPDRPVTAIWVGSGAPPLDPATTPPVRIRQEGIQFRPGTLVVQVGTPVIFPNEDQVLHAVRSQSAAKKFNVGRYMKGEDPPAVVFDKPGYVFLLCEIHEHMQGHLLVVDTPHSTTSDANGAFEITGIPPGTHTVTIWRGRKDQETREVTLQAGQVLEMDWTK